MKNSKKIFLFSAGSRTCTQEEIKKFIYDDCYYTVNPCTFNCFSTNMDLDCSPAVNVTELLRQKDCIECRFSNCEISKIESQTFKDWKRVEELNWISSKIETIEIGSFDHNTRLRKLSLARNKLETLPGDIFKKLTLLDVLDLRDNFLNEIDSETFIGLEKLKFLDLTLNFCINKKYGDRNAKEPFSAMVREEIKNDLKECEPGRSNSAIPDGEIFRCSRWYNLQSALSEPSKVSIALKKCAVEKIEAKTLKYLTQLRKF